MPVNQWNYLLLDIIFPKIDSQICQQWEETVDNAEPTVISLLEFLEKNS